jgi:hypothetical protein
MKDMLGRTVSVGDLFLIPGGNVRYGGLVLEIGVVLSMTEKRIKTLITRFDKIKLKPTTKTSTKIFKLNTTLELFMGSAITNEEQQFYAHEAVIALKAAYNQLNSVSISQKKNKEHGF